MAGGRESDERSLRRELEKANALQDDTNKGLRDSKPFFCLYHPF